MTDKRNRFRISIEVGDAEPSPEPGVRCADGDNLPHTDRFEVLDGVNRELSRAITQLREDVDALKKGGGFDGVLMGAAIDELTERVKGVEDGVANISVNREMDQDGRRDAALERVKELHTRCDLLAESVNGLRLEMRGKPPAPAQEAPEPPRRGKPLHLDRAEKASLLEAMSMGRGNREIAERFSRSLKTVRKYRAAWEKEGRLVGGGGRNRQS